MNGFVMTEETLYIDFVIKRLPLITAVANSVAPLCT